MKKPIALMLSILFLVCALPLGAGAGPALPESAHPYENGVTDVQSYTCRGAARGVFVTFSEDTYVEPFSSAWIPVPGPVFSVNDLVSGLARGGD